MPKSREEKLAAKQERGTARRERKADRKTRRTENLAARKGITTEQAGDLQANRKTRLKEALTGGLENITTGRLRFDGEDSATSPTPPADTSSSVGGDTDRLGSLQDETVGRGGKSYNRSRGSGAYDV